MAQPIPQHLRNGIENPKVIMYEGVNFAYHPNRVDEVSKNLIRYAPAFRFIEGKIEVDWDFYAQADSHAKDGIHLVLHAAGILTNICLDAIEIRSVKNKAWFYGPQYHNFLYFTKEHLSDAREFVARITKIHEDDAFPPSPHELELAQRVSDPKYIVISSNEFAEV